MNVGVIIDGVSYSYTVDFYYCDITNGIFCNQFPLFTSGEEVSTVSLTLNQDDYPYSFTTVSIEPGKDFEFYYNDDFFYSVKSTIQGYFTFTDIANFFSMQIAHSIDTELQMDGTVGYLKPGVPHTSLFLDNSLNITLVLHQICCFLINFLLLLVFLENSPG
eukprot:TRINITY_DN24680_c1_g1_i2.p2 TRINITY_DN24680_c1_g1~~TRINITY_DN24680_c1_g1_i2.p2  ORF type:complete len:162 (-),score=2.73 TRINITY_DN24680_c1_g1_i2:3-488(-)